MAAVDRQFHSERVFAQPKTVPELVTSNALELLRDIDRGGRGGDAVIITTDGRALRMTMEAFETPDAILLCDGCGGSGTQ